MCVIMEISYHLVMMLNEAKSYHLEMMLIDYENNKMCVNYENSYYLGIGV